MHSADPARYAQPSFQARCGKSGLHLPKISLGLWHNFGSVDDYANARAIALRAFDLGVTHFDLANNYGPAPGSAEETFGRILREDLGAYRDELIISTKAGYTMWPGPHGDFGSRKYLLASLDQSLKRMGLPYVDVFYSHRRDPRTPLEETMGALAQAVRSGKALYAAISNYGPEDTVRACALLRELGAPCVLHQPKYSLFERTPEAGLLDVVEKEGLGCAVFSPLAQGMLTDRYLRGVPADARAGKPHGYLRPEQLDAARMAKVRRLAEVAAERGQPLAGMALAWVLRDRRVTSALIGASKVTQLEQCVAAASSAPFAAEELRRIDAILAG
ncbi:MAG: L-glyceraldehyde 3-phosphate reductase [Verrucomicrobia bacterium]|nr:L-glyceraldehyde 3-phosphate reductase [Verrucomicrobiota bacterium]